MVLEGLSLVIVHSNVGIGGNYHWPYITNSCEKRIVVEKERHCLTSIQHLFSLSSNWLTTVNSG